MNSKTVRYGSRTALLAVVLAVVIYLGYKLVEDPSNQIFGTTVVSGPLDQRIVALTYDDGPNPPYTDRILDVLKKENVRATFFVVGRASQMHPQTLRRINREGHAIGNHTWDHPHLVMLSRTQIRTQLVRTDAILERVAGVHTRLMRPPFGARDWGVLDETRKLGYTVVRWSVPLPKDWQLPGDTTIARRVLSHVQDGSIIVLHDGNRGLPCGGGKRSDPRICDRSQDVGATRIIVESLKREGYRFVTIPELLALGRDVAKRKPGHGSE
ncbi:MAG: polysaccharide deacetylase family protein [Vulcanimicrobiaceae bacterium]